MIRNLFAFFAGTCVFSAFASLGCMFMNVWPVALYLVGLAILSVLAAMLVHVAEWMPVLRETRHEGQRNKWPAGRRGAP